MLKRLIAVALACAAVLSVAATAFAGASDQFTSPHLRTDPLIFRVHKAALGIGVSGFTGTDLLGGYADSVVTSRVGTQISILDTTAAISTAGWPQITNQALSDTSGFSFQFNLYDATGTGCESGADSIYVACQASVDGFNWFTLPTFKAGTKSNINSRLDQANVTGAFFGALSLNGAALSTGPPVWRVLYKQRAVTGWDNPDVGNPAIWPMIRFIVGFPDAKGYIVRGSVTHLTDRGE